MKETIKQLSMRITLIGCLVLVSLPFLGIFIRLIKSEAPDYIGMAALVVACGGFMTTVLYHKVQQKKVETKNNPTDS